MSTEEVKAKARQTAKSVGELLDAVQKAAHERLSKEAPKVVNTLDSSFDKATQGLTDTLKTIDKRTAKEQAELLKAYRSFLQKQAEIVDKKMASMKKERSEAGQSA
jgi:anion-transporting  ArsA/GET3 family ATPase